MHELSVCVALVDQLRDLAARHRARAITSAVVRIGPLSGVEPALLEAAFPLAAAGTPAEGAKLSIEHAPVRVRCDRCGTESPAEPSRLACPVCETPRTTLASGDEMLLMRVEMLAAGATAPGESVHV